jgi:hypothetical protein
MLPTKAKSEEARTSSDVHLLPCNIHYDGPAPVESYFHPKHGQNGELVANFRGRKLVGEVVDLPEKTKGSVIEIASKDNVVMHTSFRQIHVWEHDLKPDPRLIAESFDWLDIADAVCPHEFLIPFSFCFVLVASFIELCPCQLPARAALESRQESSRLSLSNLD